MILSTEISNTNTQILIAAAQTTGIDVEIVDPVKLQLQLTKGNKTKFVTKKSFGLNSSQSIKISRDKHLTSQQLKTINVPTPPEIEITSIKDLDRHPLPPFPLVVKPKDGEKGHDVFVGIRDIDSLNTVLNQILTNRSSALIQHQITGVDTRFFILNYQLIGLAQRHPPTITGDGTHTLRDIINLHNDNLIKQTKITGKRMQNRLLNWPRTQWHLENQGYTLDTILPLGKTIIPYPIANFQAGGTVTTIPLITLHPLTKTLVESIARTIGLTICGVDMIVKDLTQPPSHNTTFIEINSDPSLRLHEWPNSGQPQPVTSQLLNLIFQL